MAKTRTQRITNGAELYALIGFYIFIFMLTVGAYITHISWAIYVLSFRDGDLTNKEMVWAVAGLFPPVGMVSGWGVYLSWL